MYAVVVNEGPLTADDNAVYFCKEKPTYGAVEIQVEAANGDLVGFPLQQKFIRFVPTNGPSKGALMSVLLERVVSITEDEDTGLHSVKA